VALTVGFLLLLLVVLVIAATQSDEPTKGQFYPLEHRVVPHNISTNISDTDFEDFIRWVRHGDINGYNLTAWHCIQLSQLQQQTDTFQSGSLP
jgi:hypothetical protein